MGVIKVINVKGFMRGILLMEFGEVPWIGKGK